MQRAALSVPRDPVPRLAQQQVSPALVGSVGGIVVRVHRGGHILNRHRGADERQRAGTGLDASGNPATAVASGKSAAAGVEGRIRLQRGVTHAVLRRDLPGGGDLDPCGAGLRRRARSGQTLVEKQRCSTGFAESSGQRPKPRRYR